MSLFNKMFGGDKGESTASATASSNAAGVSSIASFGRYTDINKNGVQLAAWKNANESFKAKNYIESIEHFMIYLKDESVNNVSFTKSAENLSFEITQGSKVIRGVANKDNFSAEAQICIMEQNSIPVMRKLMSINFGLRYSKFALKDNILVMKFGSHAVDASPGKLYDALKELAKKSDQQDDLLLQEFSSLKEIDTDSIIQWPGELKEIKYNYLIQLIKDVKEEVTKHEAEFMSGGIAYLLLNLTYKIDYLIAPQGRLTDSLEKIQHMFFAKNNLSTRERNDQILEEYDKILNTPKEDITEGIYNVKCTFALANATAHKKVMDFMFKEREKIGWYRDNNYPQMVEAIYSYMIAYSFFNYGMVYPVSQLLNVAMALTNNEYYVQCGSNSTLIDNGVLNANRITKEVNSIINSAKKDYPNIALNAGALNYSNVSSFIDSLILQLDKLNLAK